MASLELAGEISFMFFVTLFKIWWKQQNFAKIKILFCCIYLWPKSFQSFNAWKPIGEHHEWYQSFASTIVYESSAVQRDMEFKEKKITNLNPTVCTAGSRAYTQYKALGDLWAGHK